MAVLAHEHEAEAEHDFALAVGRDRAAADLVADRDLGHVADADRHAVLGGDDDALDLLDVRRCGRAPARAAIRVPSRMLPPPTLRLFSSTASTTSSNVRPCLMSRFGIDADLVLLLVAAPAVDLGRALARSASSA